MRAEADGWVSICPYDEMIPGRGVAALLGNTQVAIFRDRQGALYAVGNYDPFCKAYVISRGLIGSHGDIPTVASPMYKHVFNLQNGAYLKDDSIRLPVFKVRVSQTGLVELMRQNSN